MTDMHHAVSFGVLAFVLVLVLGKAGARIIFGAGLVIAALAFLYVMIRIIMGTV